LEKQDLPDLKDGVFVVVPQHDSILLVKHNYGERKWSLPGGGVRQGEIVTQAARRELREETGIEQVHSMRQVGQFTLIKRYGLVVLFEAMGWFGSPRSDGQEISLCQFFNPEEINVMYGEIYPAQMKLIGIFLKYFGYQSPVYGKLTDPPTIELG